MTTDNKIRIGVVGSGIGQSHVEAYQSFPDLFEVVAICDLDEARTQKVAETCHIPRVLTDLDDLCRHTLQALTAGKHVICEKPVAGSLKEVDQLIAAEAESGKRVMPIFQYRFCPEHPMYGSWRPQGVRHD